ncbi:ependymin-related protein 1-like [Mytilus edulis]|uniref:ependymin-related protein 1-like n=1 Tax=Mytilus edulis TaxID=6550 RepID=UPI0039EE4A08
MIMMRRTKMYPVILIFTFFAMYQPTTGSICCLPRQWHAYQLVSMESTDKVYVDVLFDANLKKIASTIKMSRKGKKSQEFSLQDYANSVEYSVANNVCEKIPITTGFPWCVPDSAIVLFQSFVGTGANKIATTTYEISNSMELGDGVLTVTDGECIPINFKLAAINNGASTDVYGFEEGIPDATIFDTPATCQ